MAQGKSSKKQKSQGEKIAQKLRSERNKLNRIKRNKPNPNHSGPNRKSAHYVRHLLNNRRRRLKRWLHAVKAEQKGRYSERLSEINRALGDTEWVKEKAELEKDSLVSVGGLAVAQ